MNARRAVIIAAILAGFAPLARSGHELPVYPSYYPHEIEIAAMEAERAGELLPAGGLHAYVGGTPRFAGAPPKGIESVASLGAFLVARLNPQSPAAREEASACAVIASVARGLMPGRSDVVAHPYPVTPLHGDYLVHADRAEAAMARFAGAADGPGARSLRIRTDGPLAERLVPPERRAGSASEWDVSLGEVDARRLVAEATTHVNGWSGPRWVRSGWYHAYRLLADAVADTGERRRIDDDLARLQTGDAAGAVERANLERDLVRRLTAGCRAAVVGYTVRREYFNASFSAGIENLAPDAIEGFASPMFLRTVKLKDFPWNGWLKLANAAPPQAAWNPVGGFTDEFGRLMWFAIGDAAAIPSPYDHGWVLNRIAEIEATPRP
jgi:hypothetical protein